MGTLQYVTSEYVVEIDDRTLAHLQVVICSKLRRDERFTLRLTSEGDSTVLWMTGSVPIRFTYSTPTVYAMNPVWLRLLADAAASNDGLWLAPEPPAPEEPLVDAAHPEPVPEPVPA